MVKDELLKNKDVLIVDDLADFRSSLKRMVESCAAREVTVAINGDEALNNIHAKKFDVILCDYNLGQGKDGQQVLEEIKFKGSLKSNQVFVMITAESTTDMVMGALEYEPDAYLVKPFTLQMLLTRLESAFLMKKELLAINTALDYKQFDKALSACDEKLNSDPSYRQLVIKAKAQALIQLERFEDAKNLYQTELLERPTAATWVLLGLGKVCYQTKEYESAQRYLEELLRGNDHCPTGLDWLAKVHLAQGNANEAQSLLERAIKISPKAIQRQQALAEVALKNDDKEVLEKALRSAVSLGKNSVYRKKEDSLSLADTLINKMTDPEDSAGKHNAEEALSILEAATVAFRDDKELLVKANIFQGSALISLGKNEKAKVMLNRAQEMMKTNHITLDAKTSFATAKTLIGLGDKAQGEALLKELLLNNPDDASLIQQAQTFAEANELVVDEKTLNRQGIKFFESGQFKEAAELFEKAAKESPDNISLSLNAAQAYIQYMSKEGATPDRLTKTKAYLELGAALEKDDKRYDRYAKLVRLYKGLQK